MKKMRWKLSANTIPVGGIVYKVKRFSPKHGGKVVTGYCDLHERTIGVANDVDPDEEGYIVLHELVHATLDVMGCNDKCDQFNDEEWMQPFCRTLYAALREADLIR